MKHGLAGLVVIGLTSLFGVLPAAAQMKVLRLDYVVVREGIDAAGRPNRTILNSTRYVSPDGRLRTERLEAGSPARMVEIADEGRDEQIMLDLHSKTAIRRTRVKERAKSGVPVFDSQIPIRGQKEDLGAKVIQGFECLGSLHSVPGHTLEFWACRDPVSNQYFPGSIHARNFDGRGLWREDLQKVTRDFEVDPQIFQIPPDFKIIDK